MAHTDDPPSSAIRWESEPLVPAVIQDAVNHDVLMIGFMNQQAFTATIETGLVHFFSRSRKQLWQKGERSGNTLHVEEIRINCENNAVLVFATPAGPTCHTGHDSCFYRRLDADGQLTTLSEPTIDPDLMYSQDPVPAADDLTILWYRAYEYLRDHDLTSESGTSRRLRTPDEPVALRLADELRELAGVLDGSHAHQGLIADAILEGSQSIYWTALISIRARIPWSTLRPDRALATAEAELTRESASRLLRAEADTWSGLVAPAADLPARCHATIALIAQAVTTAGVDPGAILQRDLDDLRSRPYLAPLFDDR